MSLILAPLVAGCGAAVPQLSGRGLGHTGGTLDKLEAIPGWRAAFRNAEMTAMLNGRRRDLRGRRGPGPADRRLYALRDVTGTVESIPLIASSIMSKKIAEGTSALVLDVKVGSGAFMSELARPGCWPDHGHPGRRARGGHVALLTGMDAPLGRAVGNAVEVEESVAALRGEGPPNLVEVTLALAREMLPRAGIDADPAEALADGRALDTYRVMIPGQGGDPDAPLPTARRSRRYSRRPRMAGCRARRPGGRRGRVAARRRAGRKNDPVSAAAGVLCLGRRPNSAGAAPAEAPDRRRVPFRAGRGGAGRRGDRRRPATRRAAAGHRSPVRDRRSEIVCDNGVHGAHIRGDQGRSQGAAHDHLDGGLRASTVVDLAREIGYDRLPSQDVGEVEAWLRRGANRGR